jgi:hypothetical protein
MKIDGVSGDLREGDDDDIWSLIIVSAQLVKLLLNG